MPEIPKAYEPHAVETKWYQHWLDESFFVADPGRVAPKRPAYSIVIPPPNITGMLHMGHVLNNTIQDILARKARMDGKEVLWLPGTDHASIATHMVMERELKKEERITRHDLGREKFIERAWKWKEKYGGIIIQQLKKLGCTCDWSRERFTMDPEYSRCVEKVFVELYRKGLIYRGKRMVNWCPATLTALSDEEVEMVPQKGSLWYFQVEVAEEPGTALTIATTRPETIPGDTAIAVHPKDPRYTRLIGKHAIRPLPPELPLAQKRIPIVADDHIDPKFGTGVLKVTPAHDPADFEIGQRHHLPAVDIMEPNGKMNALAGEQLRGLDRFEARKVAVEQLKTVGAFVKDEPYENNVGFSQRAQVPIEPRLSEQWFLKYPSVAPAQGCVAQEGASAPAATPESKSTPTSPSADGELRAVREANGSGTEKMRFHPQRWAKVYDHWMSNIQDWCISRQLWWGHRIPVWTRQVNLASAPDQLRRAWPQNNSVQSVSQQAGHQTVFRFTGPESDCRIEGATESPEEAKVLESWGFTQDPDVLDTWFSSWLWPFATMGWPEKTPTLQAFYPTTDLVTAPDIIFFWVARMIMAGFEFMGEMPFRNVYFTGIIRDKLGRKMSKTLGNSPDPLQLIATYSADALRFGTMRSAPLGQDVLFDEKDVELGRNFCNKLWNACRFRQLQGGETEGEIDRALLTSDDKWILLRLDQAIREISEALDEYRFNEATQALYRFFWSEFCDWYLEASKAVSVAGKPAHKANTLAVIDFILGNTLRLFHPFLPFITEELWHGLGFNKDMPPEQGGKSIMFAHWPKPLGEEFKERYGLDESDERFVNAKYELVTQGRNLRRESNIPSSRRVKFVFKPAGGPLSQYEADVLKLLLNAETLEMVTSYEPSKGTPTVHSSLGELYLPLEGLIDLEAEKARLSKELARITSEIEKVQQKLGNANFVAKAPPAVLEDHRQRLAAWQAKQQQVETALKAL
jgi:valyl-tRNA synthetase